MGPLFDRRAQRRPGRRSARWLPALPFGRQVIGAGKLASICVVPYSAVERTHEQVIQRVSDMGAGLIIRGGIGQGHHGGQERWDVWERAQLGALAGAMSRYEFVLRFTLSHVACESPPKSGHTEESIYLA